jgi:hypothetical protein
MLSRRLFTCSIIGIAGAMACSRSIWAQASSVRLILIRQADYKDKCLSCIPGKIYGVPPAIDFAVAETVPSLLEFICDTVELSYEDNVPKKSSIPEGLYTAKVRQDGTKKWMWSEGEIGKGSILPDRSWRLELAGVPNKRTNIQFHYGKDVGWSAGCIIIGQKLAQCSATDQCNFPDSPEAAVSALRSYVVTNSLSTATPIQIRISS